MKSNEIYKQLENLAKEHGFSIRKDKGNFKSGYCYLKDSKIIIFNKNTNIDIMNSIIARSLIELEIDNHFVKPLIREYLDNEKQKINQTQNYKLEVNI